MEEIKIVKSENKLEELNKNEIVFYVQNPYNFYYNVILKNNEEKLVSSLTSSSSFLFHTPIGINEMQLLAFLRTSKHIHLTHTNIIDVIINKKIPYYNKKKYQLSLKKLYSLIDYKKYKKCEKKIFSSLLLSLNFVNNIKGYYIILPICEDVFIVYHEKEGEREKEKSDSDDIILEKIPEMLYDEKAENIISKRLPLFKNGESKNPQDINFINTLENHIIDNINNDKKIKLNSFCHKKEKKFYLVNIDFIYENDNIYLVEYDKDLNYEDKILLLEKVKFLNIEKNEIIFGKFNKKDEMKKINKFLFCIKKLWSYGYLFDDYGYNYYLEEKKIPKNNIKIPKWLKENNVDDLIMYIDGQLE